MIFVNLSPYPYPILLTYTAFDSARENKMAK